MALREPSIEVIAITVVAGNVPLAQAVQNALYTRELCGAEVPVHAGREAPLTRELETAQFVHGEDGMGDIGLPLLGRVPDSEHAVDVLLDEILASPGEVTLMTLGPLSNIAEALQREPALADAVRHCYVMGGTCSGAGNVTGAAEYNFWADPEAAQIVVRSGMPLTIVGWDMSVLYAAFGPEDAAALRSLGPLGEFAVDIQAKVDVYAREESKLAGFDLPDPIAMAVAIDPGIARFATHQFDVVAGDGPDRGRDLVDNATGGQARVTQAVERQAFVTMLARALG